MKKFSIDWVLVNKIAIGPIPRTPEHFKLLKKHKINSILSLCDEKEAPTLEFIRENFIFSRVPLPDHKQAKFPSFKEFLKALDELKKLQEFKPTFVHCLASVERSPLICLGWLVREEGYSIDLAMDYLMQIHPGTSPLPEQLSLVMQLIENKSF